VKPVHGTGFRDGFPRATLLTKADLGDPARTRLSDASLDAARAPLISTGQTTDVVEAMPSSVEIRDQSVSVQEAIPADYPAIRARYEHDRHHPRPTAPENPHGAPPA
jgi:hypothetical protein